MLSIELPNNFNPFKICRAAPKEGTCWRGQLLLKQIPGLIESLDSQPDAVVEIELLFKGDEQNFCFIEGKISSKVNFVCQRCLEPMPYEIKSSFIVSPIENEAQANQLPSAYEPLLAPNGEVSLTKWIAEELHLALPLAPCHEPSCKPRYSSGDLDITSDKPPNPFAKLAHKK